MSEAIDVFCYIGSHYKDPIVALIKGANYPKCEQNFPRLLQNLNTSQKEKDQLQ